MGLYISLKVVPISGKQGFFIDKAGVLRCYLKSAPEKGRANKELIQILSKLLRIPQEGIKIVSGETVKNKKLLLDISMTYEQLLQMLGVDQQIKMW